jgi:RNA polymerase sigma-70 factor, ECF subfamily
LSDLEKKLIEKAKNGNSDAFGQLIYQYEQKIYAIAFKVFKNEADAFDVAQEICIKLYQKLDQFRFESAFSTWLYRIATNTAIDEYRRQKRKQTHESSYDEPIDSENESMAIQIQDTSDTPEEAYLRKEKIKYVWDALQELTNDHKEIIILKDIEQKSYEEIGIQLSLSIGTVKSRLARARSSLKKELSSLWEHNLL